MKAVEVNSEMALIEACAALANDPYGFTMFNYPWGVPGTPLEDHEGPDVWQADILRTIGKELVNPKRDTAIQIAVASGHGIGKTAEISWILEWFISTRPNPQIVCTANTKVQLETKTWRELSKWHQLSHNQHWFTWAASKFYYNGAPSTWFASAIPWVKERSEAFAGTHEDYVLLLFDEASLIDDKIWEVAEGAMTTKQCIWIVFGNPTRNSGRFRECFRRFRHRWITKRIDSRTAKMANKQQIQQWLEDYGEDSDFFRVRVRGEEPRASVMQLIPEDLVTGAASRVYKQHVYYKQPKVMGIDVARQGDSMSVICKRQGVQQVDQIKLRIPDNMVVAGRIAQEIDKWRPDAVFIDQGQGVGVIDRLRQLGYTIVEVPFGSTPIDKGHYFNKRTEMWCLLKKWLENGGAIIDDRELRDDLVGPEYGFGGKMGLIQLEKKEDMIERGLASPDCGDALALTFAFPVASAGVLGHQPVVATTNYDMYE